MSHTCAQNVIQRANVDIWLAGGAGHPGPLSLCGGVRRVTLREDLTGGSASCYFFLGRAGFLPSDRSSRLCARSLSSSGVSSG